MTGEMYTQIRRPVNRLAEKILGWLSWLLILGATVIAMFFGLVLFSNENSIQRLEVELANNPTVQEILANYNLTATELVIQLQNGVWAFIVYLIVCLLISFLALISMNHRILSGILFLIVSFITLPLIVMLVPIFFFIIALMMFGRKERIESVPMYDAYEFEPQRPVYVETEREPVPPQREVDYYDAHEEKMEQPTDPSNMSRTAKYHHKQSDVQATTEDELRTDSTNVEDSYNTDHISQNDDAPYTYESIEDTVPLSKEAVKQQKKEEKAQLKAERKAARKAKKAYEKEQRQNRPSASSQRRQNYEDRMKKQQERTEQDETNKDQS
ncbi:MULTISPECIES: DUF4064 domain-containing protein [unclassified Staphylococcus]|uniref:lipoteichoic acid stability factor AuxB n=1 Tax=unclassified Staphylococcus TaxID=91994 RepID=UPI0021CE7BA9|nr:MULTISPECIES: DUF4064 domain-containing protein [unclassified Staphylococcus]UXR78970.1 DUF4064 domain-containing protein [Staphylococcus sp. IVB6227]UXR83130.1 DUF4064 domain-containing protein [Staphylococcus sp. IVB6214]